MIFQLQILPLLLAFTDITLYSSDRIVIPLTNKFDRFSIGLINFN